MFPRVFWKSNLQKSNRPFGSLWHRRKKPRGHYFGRIHNLLERRNRPGTDPFRSPSSPVLFAANERLLKDWVFLERIYYKMSLRVILQHRKSLLYLKGLSEWTPNIREAREFKDIVHAIDFAQLARLTELDVLMHFGDSKYDIRLAASR
jgi:hypothetical protein